jgi:hypothetical protein
MSSSGESTPARDLSALSPLSSQTAGQNKPHLKWLTSAPDPNSWWRIFWAGKGRWLCNRGIYLKAGAKDRDSKYPDFRKLLILKLHILKYARMQAILCFPPFLMLPPWLPSRTNFRILWTGLTGSFCNKNIGSCLLPSMNAALRSDWQERVSPHPSSISQREHAMGKDIVHACLTDEIDIYVNGL